MHSKKISTAGAVPVARGLVMAPRADASNVSAQVAEFQRVLAEFRQKNDERVAELEAGLRTANDPEPMERMNARLDELTDNIREAHEAATRAALSGGGGDGGDDPAAEARRFSAVLGREVSPEDFGEYRAALNAHFRQGASAPRDMRATLETGSDPAGGYLVPPTMSDRIVTRVRESSPMRQLATVETIGRDRLEYVLDMDDVDFGWVGETGERDETSTPGLDIAEIPVREMFAQPKATQRNLDDSIWDVEAWLERKAADRFARGETTAFFTGDTPLKPRGLLTYPTVAAKDGVRPWGKFQHVGTGKNGGFADADPGDALIDLVFAVKNAHRQGATFLMNRAALGAVRKLKGADGQYLWQPDFTQRVTGSLLSYGITEAEDMPEIGNGSLSIGFGDMGETYTIVDRAGITLLRDPYTKKGYVKFYMTRRVGGDVTNFETFKFLKFSA